MDARTAIFKYCNYQDRCHSEVRNKLYELGCKTPEVEQYIAELIENNVLNEERYARSIARGKFRMKQWGRIKIIQQLKLNKISDYCIKAALTEIDGDEYIATLQKLATKKWREFKKGKDAFSAKAKLHRYLLQKGYENDLIKDCIPEIIQTDN